MTPRKPPEPTSLRERKKARTRKALVEAALARFRDQGFEKTTLDQITADAGVGRRTFFRYFPCKEAVVFPHADSLMEGFARQVQLREAEESRLASLRRAWLKLAADFDAAREDLTLQKRLVESSPALAGHEKLVNARWASVVETSMLQAVPMSESKERQTRILATAAVAALLATMKQWIAAGCVSDLGQDGQRTLDMFEHGLGQSIPELTDNGDQ